MKKFMKIKQNKDQINNSLKEIDHGHFKKSYKTRFTNQINNEQRLVSLQAAYYLICYFSHESDNSNAKIKKGTIKKLFNKIFEVDFDLFYSAVEGFRLEDLKGSISNNGGSYSLRILKNREECEAKLFNHLKKIPEVNKAIL